MPETRRTKPGFLSNNEYARDQRRTQDAVSGLMTSKEFEKRSSERQIETKPYARTPSQPEAEIVCIDSTFWASNKGLIVKAIVLNKSYNKQAILRSTGLTDTQYRAAATVLFETGLLTEKYPGNLWVPKDLYVKCIMYFKTTR
jgi:hypothetical protein